MRSAAELAAVLLTGVFAGIFAGVALGGARLTDLDRWGGAPPVRAALALAFFAVAVAAAV